MLLWFCHHTSILLDNDIVGFYESQLETYDDVNSHFEIYYKEFAGWIERHVGADRHLITDMGCGTGTLSRLLAEQGRSVCGVDVSINLIKRAAVKSGGNFFPIIGDIACLPVRDCSFDVAVCFGVLDQVDRIEDVLGEAARILKPGGIFLFDISPFPTLDFWYFFGLYGRSGFASAVEGMREKKTRFEWAIKGDDGVSRIINIYRYRPSHIERLAESNGFSIIGKRGFHISKMIIPEKVHVDGRSTFLSRIDGVCSKIDGFLNKVHLMQNNALYLMYAGVKMRTNAK